MSDLTHAGMSILLAFEEGKEVGRNLSTRESAALALLKDFGRASKRLKGARTPEAFEEAAREYRRVLSEVKEMAEGMSDE